MRYQNDGASMGEKRLKGGLTNLLQGAPLQAIINQVTINKTVSGSFGGLSNFLRTGFSVY